MLVIKQTMSTASHPLTDGHTERIYQIIEADWLTYCNNELNDWASMLAIAEFAYNN